MLAVLALAFAGGAFAGERCTAVTGNTLQCGRERVLVEGLRAPAPEAPDGQQARQRLQRRIQGGEIVIERGERDKYGRTRGRLYVNGTRITQLELGKPAPQNKKGSARS
jgi:endonuclease YncB( thermonuclease family)